MIRGGLDRYQNNFTQGTKIGEGVAEEEALHVLILNPVCVTQKHFSLIATVHCCQQMEMSIHSTSITVVQ